MKEDIKKHLRLIFNAVGVAMGIAVIVLVVLNKINQKDAIYMLGIGLLSISMSAIFRKDINNQVKPKVKKRKTKIK